MASELQRGESPNLNQEARQIWDQNAAFWDDRFREGNDFHKTLVEPSADRLLALRPGEQVLEIACGNGAYARHLAQQGAHVVATDFSQAFLDLARQRTSEHADRLDYRPVDATDTAQLLALGEHRFDAAVANMALMDMAAIEPLLGALTRLLKPEGRFVFSVMHPCFNSSGIRLSVEEDWDQDGSLRTLHSVRVVGYLGLQPAKGLGMIGQPQPQYYFHRPLSVLLAACFRAGFALDGLEEPSFPAAATDGRPFSWEHYPEIPPILVARLRLSPPRGPSPAES